MRRPKFIQILAHHAQYRNAQVTALAEDGSVWQFGLWIQIWPNGKKTEGEYWRMLDTWEAPCAPADTIEEQAAKEVEKLLSE